MTPQTAPPPNAISAATSVARPRRQRRLRAARRAARTVLQLGLFVVALAAAACSTIGATDRTALSLHLENAAQYYDQAHFERAHQQWGKALELDPLNDKARLGQAMSLYQLGHEESTRGVGRLRASEEQLEDLRREDLDGQEWKAELGYALVQDRWVDLLDRKERLQEAQGDGNRIELAKTRKERTRRIGLAEQSYAKVLSGGEQEAQYQLTCMLGLSKMAAYAGDYERSLMHAREYEDQVLTSKSLWRESIEKFPKDAPLYEQKLRGAERQEAVLRDLIGNVFYKLGRLDEAEEQLSIVLELDPRKATAFLNRGIVRSERDDWDRARQDLRTYLSMVDLPEDEPSVVEAMSRLEIVEEKIRAEDASFGDR